MTGNVRLKATFCYASPTDPQDAAAYTKAGLEVVFRPNDEKIKDGKSNADTKGFFELKKFATEQERRSDQGKWETVLHGAKTFRGSSLRNPVFDIHNARDGGGRATGPEVRYALILSVSASTPISTTHLHLCQDAGAIQPQVTLPIASGDGGRGEGHRGLTGKVDAGTAEEQRQNGFVHWPPEIEVCLARLESVDAAARLQAFAIASSAAMCRRKR